MNRKAQAATEFLSTYIFMILGISILVMGLAYFGVLDLTKLLPIKCQFPPGITCIDQKATTDSVSLVLVNNLGHDINVTEIEMTQCELLNPHILELNEMSTYHMSCDNLYEGKYKSDISFTFARTDTGLSQTIVGELITRIPSKGPYY